MTPASIGCADRGEQRPRLRPRLLDLGLGLGVPDDAAADPEMDPLLGDRERADRQRELEVAVRRGPCRARPSTRRGRRARARRSGRRAAIFGAPVTEPPGNVAASSSARPTSLAQRSLDRRDEVRDAGELALDHQLRPAHASPARRRGRGRCARGRRSSRARPRPSRPRRARRAGACPLIGHVQTRRPRRARKSSGEAETIAQPSPASAPRPRTRASRAGEPRRVAGERRRQVLDEVDLVDVAAPDRRPHRLDRLRVLRVAPRPLPLSDGTRRVRRARPSDVSRTATAARGSGHGSGGAASCAAQRLRESVAEIEIRFERLAAGARRSRARAGTPRSARTRPPASAARARLRQRAGGGAEELDAEPEIVDVRPLVGRVDQARGQLDRPSSATGRSRTRRCRRPRAASASR